MFVSSTVGQEQIINICRVMCLSFFLGTIIGMWQDSKWPPIINELKSLTTRYEQLIIITKQYILDFSGG